MINGTAKLVIDLGNSETRVKTYFGKTVKGNPRSRLTVLDNRYSVIPEEKVSLYLDSDYYNEDNSSIFKTDNGAFYCNGALCNEEFQQTSVRPSALEHKYETFVSKLTVMNAIRQGIVDVSIFSNCDIDSVNVDWELYLLLPPEDIDRGAKKLNDLVREIKSLNMIMPKFTKNINIVKVNVYPEGMCAFFGVIFKNKGVIRPDYRYLLEGTESTLICDIGAGTTDFVMVKGSQVIQSSRFTKEVGGNNVHRLVQRSLRDKGISLPEEVIKEGIRTGLVKSGSKAIDITDEIAKAQQAVSSQLVDAVQEFFESSMISIRTISNILICGGGAEESNNPALSPISDYIVNYMRRLSPDIKLIDLPIVISEGEQKKLSPRLLNILGAGVLAEG